MNHLEQNKLIALFLGAEYKQDDYEQWGYWFEKPFVENWHTGFNADALKFHTSWDWLMPVVEKIYTMQEYRQSEPYYNVCKCYLPTPIELVYSLVVKFIEWYYNQQPPHLTQAE